MAARPVINKTKNPSPVTIRGESLASKTVSVRPVKIIIGWRALLKFAILRNDILNQLDLGEEPKA